MFNLNTVEGMVPAAETENRFPVQMSELPVSVSFGVDPVETDYPPFPAQIHMLDSVDFLAYEVVLACLTDENTFFQLQSVDAINAAQQRTITMIPDPFADDQQVLAITVSLPGLVDPGVLLALMQNATAAGHMLLPVLRKGIGACEYSIFTLIPHYKVV